MIITPGSCSGKLLSLWLKQCCRLSIGLAGFRPVARRGDIGGSQKGGVLKCLIYRLNRAVIRRIVA